MSAVRRCRLTVIVTRRTGTSSDDSSTTYSYRLVISGGRPFGVVGDASEDATDEGTDDLALVLGAAAVVRARFGRPAHGVGHVGDRFRAERVSHQGLRGL